MKDAWSGETKNGRRGRRHGRLSFLGPSSLASLILAVLSAFAAHAAIEEAAEREAKLILRVLSYDRALDTWAKDQLRILVLTRASTKGLEECDPQIRALRALEGYTVGGRSVRVSLRPYDERSDLEPELATREVEAVFLCPSVVRDLEWILRSCVDRRITSLATDRDFVRQGVSVGVVVEEGLPKILMNPEAIKKQGHLFSAQILKLAELLE